MVYLSCTRPFSSDIISPDAGDIAVGVGMSTIVQMPLFWVLGIGELDLVSNTWLGPYHCSFISNQLDLWSIVLDTWMRADTSQQVTRPMFIGSEQVMAH